MTHLTRVWMHSFVDFTWSFGFHVHCVAIVMQLSHGRLLSKAPIFCSGVAKSPGCVRRLFMRMPGCSVRSILNVFLLSYISAQPRSNHRIETFP